MSRDLKNKIRKASVLVLSLLMSVTVLCGCMFMPKTSSKYLVGFDYSSYKDVFGMAAVIDCAVRYDKSVDATFTWVDENGERETRVLNFPLTDRQYSMISQYAAPDVIYHLNPKCSDPSEVCDGGSCWLFLYGTDDQVMKKCGGFCPTSKRFNEIRRVIFDNIPEELEKVYSEYEVIYDAQFSDGGNPVYDDKYRTLFDEKYAEYIED